MTKLTAIVLTAAICLPLGALLQHDAAAERRKSSLPLVTRPSFIPIEGHRHLSLAREALQRAVIELDASQEAGEPLWSDSTGQAAATRQAITTAATTLERTSQWVRAGMSRNSDDVR